MRTGWTRRSRSPSRPEDPADEHDGADEATGSGGFVAEAEAIEPIGFTPDPQVEEPVEADGEELAGSDVAELAVEEPIGSDDPEPAGSGVAELEVGESVGSDDTALPVDESVEGGGGELTRSDVSEWLGEESVGSDDAELADAVGEGEADDDADDTVSDGPEVTPDEHPLESPGMAEAGSEIDTDNGPSDDERDPQHAAQDRGWREPSDFLDVDHTNEPAIVVPTLAVITPVDEAVESDEVDWTNGAADRAETLGSGELHDPPSTAGDDVDTQLDETDEFEQMDEKVEIIDLTEPVTFQPSSPPETVGGEIDAPADVATTMPTMEQLRTMSAELDDIDAVLERLDEAGVDGVDRDNADRTVSALQPSNDT